MIVETDDPAVGIDKHDDDRRDVDHGAREGLLALDGLEPTLELVLEAASVGEVADDHDHLVVARRNKAALEPALLPVDRQSVVDRLDAGGGRLRERVDEQVGDVPR